MGINNPYETLGVEENASKKEIRRAYIELVKQHHPDRIKDAREAHFAEEMLKEINFAYSQLTKGSYKEKFIDNQNVYAENQYAENRYTEKDDGNKYIKVRELLGKKRLIEAEWMLKTIISRDAEWNYLNGVILLNNHKYDEALNYLNNAIQQDSQNKQYMDMFEYTKKTIEEREESWKNSQKRSSFRRVIERLIGITDYAFFGVALLFICFIFSFVEDLGKFAEEWFLKAVYLINLAQMNILKSGDNGIFLGNISLGLSLWYVIIFLTFASQIKVFLNTRDGTKKHMLNVYISIFIFAVLFVINNSYMYIFEAIAAIAIVHVVKLFFCKLFSANTQRQITNTVYIICVFVTLYLCIDICSNYSVVTGENICFRNGLFSATEKYSIADIEHINISYNEEKTYDWRKSIEGFENFILQTGEKKKFKYYSIEYDITLKNGKILKVADSPEFFGKIQEINPIYLKNGIKVDRIEANEDKLRDINEHLSPIYNKGTGSYNILKRLFLPALE